MIEYFNLAEKTPEFSDVLIMWHSGELIKGALSYVCYTPYLPRF